MQTVLGTWDSRTPLTRSFLLVKLAFLRIAHIETNTMNWVSARNRRPTARPKRQPIIRRNLSTNVTTVRRRFCSRSVSDFTWLGTPPNEILPASPSEHRWRRKNGWDGTKSRLGKDHSRVTFVRNNSTVPSSLWCTWTATPETSRTAATFVTGSSPSLGTSTVTRMSLSVRTRVTCAVGSSRCHLHCGHTWLHTPTWLTTHAGINRSIMQLSVLVAN